MMADTDCPARRTSTQAHPRHVPGDYPDRLFWCVPCSALVLVWGGSGQPPPRCPECHANLFAPGILWERTRITPRGPPADRREGGGMSPTTDADWQPLRGWDLQTRREPAGRGWQASLQDDPTTWSRGDTEAEAIGTLLLRFRGDASP